MLTFIQCFEQKFPDRHLGTKMDTLPDSNEMRFWTGHHDDAPQRYTTCRPPSAGAKTADIEPAVWSVEPNGAGPVTVTVPVEPADCPTEPPPLTVPPS